MREASEYNAGRYKPKAGNKDDDRCPTLRRYRQKGPCPRCGKWYSQSCVYEGNVSTTCGNARNLKHLKPESIAKLAVRPMVNYCQYHGNGSCSEVATRVCSNKDCFQDSCEAHAGPLCPGCKICSRCGVLLRASLPARRLC